MNVSQYDVAIIGGGPGGYSAALYGASAGLDIALIEPTAGFVTCPFSNDVLTGRKAIGDITHGYQALEDVHKIRIVRDTAAAIDALRGGARFAVIAGTGTAEVVYPQSGQLVSADENTKAAAKRAVAKLSPTGGTAIGSCWPAASAAYLRARGPSRSTSR